MDDSLPSNLPKQPKNNLIRFQFFSLKFQKFAKVVDFAKNSEIDKKSTMRESTIFFKN